MLLGRAGPGVWSLARGQLAPASAPPPRPTPALLTPFPQAGLVGTSISNGLLAVRKKMDPDFKVGGMCVCVCWGGGGGGGQTGSTGSRTSWQAAACVQSEWAAGAWCHDGDAAAPLSCAPPNTPP